MKDRKWGRENRRDFGWEGVFCWSDFGGKKLEGSRLFQHPQVGEKMERRRG